MCKNFRLTYRFIQNLKKVHNIKDLSQISSNYLNIQTEKDQETTHEPDGRDYNWHNKVPETLLITEIIGQDEEIKIVRQSCNRFGYTVIKKWENIVNIQQNTASRESKLKTFWYMVIVNIVTAQLKNGATR